jgi:hypothetical protein
MTVTPEILCEEHLLRRSLPAHRIIFVMVKGGKVNLLPFSTGFLNDALHWLDVRDDSKILDSGMSQLQPASL